MTPDEVSLTIGELAAMVGVSTDTIRAWERRHGVLSPGRTLSRHRRYTMADAETLRRVRRNVNARGLSLKLAVAEAHGLQVDDPRPFVAQEPLPERHADSATEPWRAVADLLPEVMCMLDEEGYIIDANIAFARMAGVLRLQVRGTRFLELVDAGDRAKAARVYRPRLTARRAWEINLRTPMVSGLYSFDCFVVPTMTRRILVLIGRDLSASTMEVWPATALASLARTGPEL